MWSGEETIGVSDCAVSMMVHLQEIAILKVTCVVMQCSVTLCHCPSYSGIVYLLSKLLPSSVKTVHSYDHPKGVPHQRQSTFVTIPEV